MDTLHTYEVKIFFPMPSLAKDLLFKTDFKTIWSSNEAIGGLFKIVDLVFIYISIERYQFHFWCLWDLLVKEAKYNFSTIVYRFRKIRSYSYLIVFCINYELGTWITRVRIPVLGILILNREWKQLSKIVGTSKK